MKAHWGRSLVLDDLEAIGLLPFALAIYALMRAVAPSYSLGFPFAYAFAWFGFALFEGIWGTPKWLATLYAWVRTEPERETL